LAFSNNNIISLAVVAINIALAWPFLFPYFIIKCSNDHHILYQ
jgi:hypothetical protein